MKSSKPLGRRASATRDGERLQLNADGETAAMSPNDASGAEAPESDKRSLHQDEIAQHTHANLMTLDTIACGSLSPAALARYEAYKCALIVSDHDLESVAQTLAVFMRDLYVGSPSTTLH